MSERTFFIGSVGPLLYDDADKAYEDSDMLEDDIVAPYQKALWGDVPETSTNLPLSGSDSTSPGSVSNLRLVTSGLGGITIAWDAPVATPDIDNYSVYWATSSTYIEGTTALIGTVPAPVTQFTHVYNHPLTTAFTCYYWVKAIDSSKNTSVLAGPLTVVATTTYDDAISKVVNSLIDTPVANGVTFKLDKLKIGPGGTEQVAPVTVFTIGTINGLPAIAIKGDMFVDGSVNARALTAGSIVGNLINATTTLTLSEGGTAAFGASGSNNEPDIKILTTTGSGQGKLIVYDGLSNPGYNSTTEFWRSTIAHYVSTNQGTTFENPPRRLVTGFCKHRASVNIPGYFPHMPQVVVFPSFAWGATGKLTCHPGPLNPIAFGQWSFTMYCSMSGTNTQNRAPNAEIEVPYSSFISTPITSSRIYCKEDGTSSYSYTRIAVRIMVRAQSGAGNNPTGSIMTINLYGRKSNGVEVAYTTQVYADTDHRSYWLMVDSPDLLFDSIRVVATHSSTLPSRYRWPIGTGQASLRVEMMISYPTIPAATNEVGSYIAYF